MIAFIGKSASGKDTIVNMLCQKYGYHKIVTTTTRPPRPGEIDGVTYDFVNNEEFYDMISEDKLLEWREYETVSGCWYYGVPFEKIRQADSKSVIILTPEGVEALRYKNIPLKVIYIYSNLATIKNRLMGRGDNPDEAARRTQEDQKDFKNAAFIADRIIYNNGEEPLDVLVENIHNKLLEMGGESMQVIKRDCSLEEFNKTKIVSAILKSMKYGSGIVRVKIAEDIADEIENECMVRNEDEIDISDIESMIYNKLIDKGQRLTSKDYEGFRRIREFQKENRNTTDREISELLNGLSDYWNDENSNKNPKLLTTQRDHMAGIESTDITRRFLLPPHIVQAHDDGIIHFHDSDYFGQNAITNCCLINLGDMLQNGTCINRSKIEKPHRLLTATTISTQIITAVSSSQYGGATITLTDLAPFVRESYYRFLEKHLKRGIDKESAEKYAKEDLKETISDSVQTFNYQCNTMTTTNGQAPFISVCMYLEIGRAHV